MVILTPKYLNKGNNTAATNNSCEIKRCLVKKNKKEHIMIISLNTLKRWW